MYDNLFTPLRLAGVTLPNRIARGAHGTSLPWLDVNEDLIAYHGERARLGVGLVFLEKGGVHPSTGGLFPAYSDSMLSGYERLSHAVHAHGSKVFVQLLHRGGAFGNGLGGQPWSASDVPNPVVGLVPIPMTQAMIDDVVEGFARSAAVAQEGGIDGIEVHACHGYLLGEFLSPATNHRTDAYGGATAGRAKLLVDIVAAVRGEVGTDFPISVRLSADDEAVGGLVPAEAADVARLLEGTIDLLSLSVGTYQRFHRTLSTVDDPEGYQLPAALVVRQAVATPTMVTGRIPTLARASQVIADGVADVVSMVRALLADPYLIEKSRAGRTAQVRPCLYTNEGCIAQIGPHGRIGCIVNVAAGHERTVEFDVVAPAERSLRVLVVGGGPAGLEAARSAALRGHTVELHEAGDHLGGQLAIAAAAPHRSGVGALIPYLLAELERLGVVVHLGSPIDAMRVGALDVEVVVVATGSRPRQDGLTAALPGVRLPGSDLPHVRTSWDVLGFGAAFAPGATAVVYDETGRFDSISVAENLLESGAKVTLVTPHPMLGGRMPLPMATIGAARERLLGAGGAFTLMTSSYLSEISPGQVMVVASGTRTATYVEAQDVVLVGYNAIDRSLPDALGMGDGPVRVEVIGDAAGGTTIQQAVHGGVLIGRAL
jgi:2,4-dienoyl-CoA reductase-like NADH-dependent reductase (Old Yellow Enzyme family)